MNTSTAKDKIIYVASPYAGDIDKNVRYAQNACRAVLLAGAHPYAPHLYITNILRDDVPEERAQGLKTGLAFLAVCDELWVFGPRISNGMAGEIEEAKRLGKPIRYVDLDLKIVERDDASNTDPLLTPEGQNTLVLVPGDLRKTAENLGWSWSKGAEEHIYVEFSRCSSAGENFSFTVWGSNDEEIAENVRKYASGFNAEEHAMMLKNSNMTGVPDLETLLEDAKEIQKILDELADALETALNLLS